MQGRTKVILFTATLTSLMSCAKTTHQSSVIPNNVVVSITAEDITCSEHFHPSALIQQQLWGAPSQIDSINTFACNGKDGFGFATIDSDMQISYKAVKIGFPERGTSFHATEDGSILWGQEGYRGLWAIDITTGKTINGGAFVNDGSSDLGEVWAVPGKNSKLLANAIYPSNSRYNKSLMTFACYDFKKEKFQFRTEYRYDNTDSTSQNFRELIHWDEHSYLGMSSYKDNEKYKTNWKIQTVGDSGFNVYSRTPLTEMLSDSSFRLSYERKRCVQWNMKKRFILGYIKDASLAIGRRQIPTIAQINESRDAVSFTSLKDNIPVGYRFNGGWLVSPDGNWIRCKLKKDRVSEYSSAGNQRTATQEDDKNSYTGFFHVNEKYPGGVSKGKVALSSHRIEGVFVEHDTFGTLYLDRVISFPSSTVLYTMNDFLTHENSDSSGIHHITGCVPLARIKNEIALDSNNISPYIEAAYTFQSQKRLYKTLEYCNRALSIDSTNLKMLILRSSLYTNSNLGAKAIEDYTTIIENHPLYMDAFIHRGVLYKRQEEFQKALVDFKMYTTYSTALKKPQKSKPKAGEPQKRYREMSPEEQQEYNKYYKERGRYQNAKHLGARSFAFQGDVYFALKEYQNAANAYLEGYNQFSYQRENANSFAWSVYTGRITALYPEALELVSKAIRMNGSRNCYDTRGRLHYEMGSYPEAIEDLNKFIPYTKNKLEYKSAVVLVEKMGGTAVTSKHF